MSRRSPQEVLKEILKRHIIKKDGTILTKDGYPKSQRLCSKGYLTITIVIKDRRYRQFSHRIVAAKFHGIPPEGYVTNHKNGIKTDNRAENLEWVTVAENNQHAIDTGLRKCYSNLMMRRIPKIREPKAEMMMKRITYATFAHYFRDEAKTAKFLGIAPHKFRREIILAEKAGLVY